MPPVVITEFLSDPNLANAHRAIATQVRFLPLLLATGARRTSERAFFRPAEAKLADCSSPRPASTTSSPHHV